MSRNLFTIADSFAAVGTRSTRASKELPVCLQGCLRIHSGEDVTSFYPFLLLERNVYNNKE